MNINFTLFVQAFNFFVAYIILRIFLFKPAITVINQERAEEKGLQDMIERKEQTNIALANQNQQQWQTYQKDFFAHIPRVNTTELFIYKELAPVIKPPQFKVSEFGKLQDEVAQYIIQKVEHVP